MTRIFRLLVAVSVLAGLGFSARAADTFEGRVAMTLSSADGGAAMNYALKGGRMRVEIAPATASADADAAAAKKKAKKPRRGGDEARTGVMIIDQTKREMLMVMESEKMFMRMPLRDPAGATAAGDRAIDDTKITPTGRTETIAGQSAEQFLLEGKNGEKTELWLAQGLGSWFNPDAAAAGGPFGGGRGGAGKLPAAWEAWARQNGFFPLRVVSLDHGGQETSRMEVTAVERTALPESLFQPPAGYTEFQMPAGMGGMFGR